jgi:hypothetical protein
MLCEAMVILEKYMGKTALAKECSQQLLEWWQRHQMKEEDRVRAEAAGKLTERERMALGIDERGQNTRTRLIRGSK